MANFQDMIEFLRINRRSEEANKNILLSDNVLLTPLEGGENYYVNRNIFENNFTIYKRLFSVLNANNVYIIYLWETSSDKKYLFQKNTLEYINLLDGATEFPNPSELVEYSIETDNYSIYFYDVSENTIVIKYEDLPETILFTDIIPYNPVKEPLSYFNNGETLIYEYDDETSTTYSALRSVLQHVSTFGAPKAIHNSYRFVDILKDNENGNIHLIPKLYYYSLKSRYFLKYEFWKPTQLEVKKIRPFYEIPNENVALSLEFHSKGAFIMFLNQTIFSQSNFDFSKTYKGDRRQQFKQEFTDLIITPLEKSLFSPNLNYNDIFTTLYYLHESVTVNLSDKFIWFILEWAISKDDLTNFSIKEEDIFIKLIKLLLLKEGQEVKLMNWFLETKIDNDKKITKFEFIYNRIDGSNFMEFAKLVSQVWKKSRFIYPDIEKNPEFATTDGLLFLPYSSKKHLGFYFSSVDMSFENHDKKGRLLKTLYKTDKTQKVIKALPRGGTYKDDKAIIDTVWYHPFYPIYLKDIANQETEVKLDAIVPAFMLKANQDKQFWSNVITTAEYAADILTTVSGVGNIAKFRYLANFATKASRLRFVSEAGEAVANVKKVVAATAAAVEITSGTVNTLLKLSGARDAAWGKSLSEYLFWLELLSLSGELSVAIHNGLRKSAKEILEHEDELIEEASKGKYNIDDLLDELHQIAEEKVRNLNIGDELADIAEIDIKSVAKIADRIRKTTKLKNFDIMVVDRNNEALFDLFKAWQKEPRVEGVFIPRNGVYKRYGVNLKGPRIYLFTGNTSEGFMKIKAHTLQHEVFHVEMHSKLIEQLGLEKYQLLIDRIPTHIKEEYVVHRFLTTDSKALEFKELEIELDNINNKYRKNANLNHSLDKDYLTKEWNLKNELKKLNINY